MSGTQPNTSVLPGMSEFKPWEEYPEIWGTQAKFMAWVRGGIRRGLWEEHPVKLQFLNSQKIYIENTNPRSMKRFPTVAAYRCAICGEVYKASKEKGQRSSNTQVDHIVGNHSLKTMEDLRAFIESMILVRMEDLQIACKACHDIKSYSEKEGCDFEEARIRKKALAICNEKKDKEFLRERGYVPGTNAEKRRTQIEDILRKEQ